MVNIHETSIGQLYDLDMLKNIAKEYDLFFVVILRLKSMKVLTLIDISRILKGI